MSLSCKNNENVRCSKASGTTTVLTLLAAAGLTAGALFLAKKLHSQRVAAGVEDLLNLCDRAATKLDERLGSVEIALAG